MLLLEPYTCRISMKPVDPCLTSKSSADWRDHQEKLKLALKNDIDATEFEHLAAALLSHLLDVPIVVAKAGFQYGGDAGPVGRKGRRFRLECKKYSDTSSLSERELLGEIDQAMVRDEALEAWFLIATRTVPEQTQQTLIQHGERQGIPVIIIDWGNELVVAPLAALCASAPDLVDEFVSSSACEDARALQAVSGDAIEALRRDLQSWCLGFDSLRARSFETLNRIWNSPQASKAALGQNAAGGAQEKKVKRGVVHEALNAWWRGPARDDAPAAVVGLDGVGKTWATLEWLVDSQDDQPIVLLIPSSAVASGTSSITKIGVKDLLAQRLYEMTEVRDADHWSRRLNHLLKRPVDEGPVLTVFFDGLNQEPSVEWSSLLQVLQDEIFEKRVRVIFSTRDFYFYDRLSALRSLIVPSKRVDVGQFDREPRGELDRMLEFEDLHQTDLRDDVIQWACVPRLFNIVVRLREKLVGSGQITVHRILWEYGRDSFGERNQGSFSPNEWEDWLKEIAAGFRRELPPNSLTTLSETVGRRDLDPEHVYARLSDIIDGQFATRTESGDFELNPTIIAHALGVALLAHFRRATSPSFETLQVELAEWLDPIAGFDELADILRAAVSILVAKERPAEPPVTGVLVTAWLQSQNMPEEHLQELAALAPSFPDALLDAVEHSGRHYHDAARLRAVDALRAIPRKDSGALTKIVARARRWLSEVRSDDVGPGVDTVLDVKLVSRDRAPEVLKAAVPSIIEGFPLAKTLPILETESVASTFVGRPSECWEGLRWLCLFNKVDPDETATALRAMAEEIGRRQPETGVNLDLPKRIAIRLLRLTYKNEDEDTAASIYANTHRKYTYEKDYLPRPGRSFFALERRHAEIALNDTELTLVFRVQRTRELWFDPTFEPPSSFVEELHAAVASIDVEQVGRSSVTTTDNYVLRELEPVLARCAPDLLADLIRRTMRSIATSPPVSRYWSAIHATEHFVLAGQAEAEAAQALRLRGREDDETKEAYAANKLLLMEVRDLDAQTQFDILIQADLNCIFRDFCEVLRPLTAGDIDTLITRYALGAPKQQVDLLSLLSCHSLDLSDSAWSWIADHANQRSNDCRWTAFQILTHADPMRFGRLLAADGWSWEPDESFEINHHGTKALVEATLDLPFNDVAPRLAPWLLLSAARRRGTEPDEVQLAAGILGQWLLGDSAKESNPGLNVDAKDFEPVFQHAPSTVEEWLEGCSGPTAEFQNRAHSSIFRPLCEALLAHDPCRGVQLWRVLYKYVNFFQYIGAANVDTLWHMIFRVPDSPAVMALREEIAELEYCHTDQALFDLAIAASYNHESDWLANRIEADQTSALTWKRKRAVVLAGFTSNNVLPIADAWPDGEIQTCYEDLAMMSARYRWTEACARHWWQVYLKASNPEEAYAAWVLFLRSADRRAWVWLQQDIETARDSGGFFKRKMIHFLLNRENLKSAMKKLDDKIDRKFLYREVSKGVGPWV